jgi:hypothetical protein
MDGLSFRRKEMTRQEIHIISTSDIVKKLTAIVAPIIKNDLESGMSLKNTEKHIDKELKKVTNVVKLLAFSDYKRR